ncbi:MAG: universal stress protein [Chloroflexi bacterium]|nr:universal stress protein [Chloroflexota bacterium]
MLIVRGNHEGDPEPDADLKTIVVPVDGSPLAESVIPHVTALAKALDLKVTLLRVVPTVEEFSSHTDYQRLDGVVGLHFKTSEDMAKEAADKALVYLKELENTLRKEGVALVDHRLVRGGAANIIIDIAQETPDNLVAMTTHGRSGPARWTLGSVADRVVRHSGDPVLVVRTG